MKQERHIRAEVFLRPPPRIADHVVAFCHAISPRHTPLYVSARPQPGTRPGMCFHNVQSLCSRRGGDPEYGWLIWEWKDTYIEAEHHAVWRIGKERIEVTPRDPSHPRVLFLPQPEKAFDFTGRRRVDNIRLPLRSDTSVREYLALAARIVEIEESSSVGDEVSLSPEHCYELDRIRSRMGDIERQFTLWSINRVGRNEACWCGSGKKLKRCCAYASADRGTSG